VGVHMRQKRQQFGVSMIGILAILVMVGFFAMCAIRMVPHYTEFLSVKKIVSDIVMEPETKGMSSRQIRRRIENIFNSNQIYALKAADVKIVRKRGLTYIDSRYEVRMPIAWRIDAVISFNDLLMEVGKAELLTEIPK
jgi:hypothetical protein